MPKRNEIDNKFKWKIEDLFANDELWRKSYNDLKDNIYKMESFKGNLTTPRNVFECLKLRDELSVLAEQVFVYATMKFHENTKDGKYQSISDLAESLTISFSASTSYIEPEILELPEDFLEKAIEEIEGFNVYEHYFKEIFRSKEHMLDAKGEELLAKTQDLASASSNIYDMIHDADMVFKPIKNSKGEQFELTQGKYISYMESFDRELRTNAFHSYYETYIAQKNTLASVYYANVKKDFFYAKIRNFKSSLDEALFSYNIPEEVYINLIETIHNHLPLIHKYIDIRKEALGVSELHMYDLYVPIVKDANTEINYDDAKETVIKALAPLGEEYVSKVKEALENGWVDVYENDGKRSGAYAWGAFGAHPYILMNFDNKINDMFTLAHEIGHAMHSHYTWSNQPYVYANYTIFVAEVASTVNECLLMNYLINNTKDEILKKYLVNYSLEQFRGTVFRQTMFAEFEMKAHNLAQNETPLTWEVLNELYRDLNILYYGKNIVMDEQIDYEWSRIPHFYSAFYVYQYATGYCAAVAISNAILNNGEKAVNDYLSFLKSGSSNYSIDLLKKAGADMTDPETIKSALKTFEKLLEEI